MNKKNIIISVFILLVLITGISMLFKWNSLKEINKEEIDVSKYIECVDLESNSKAQVNWKYVVSIVGVLNNNNFENITDNEINEITNLFIVKEKNSYKVLSFEDVVNSLDLNKNQIKRVYNYIDDLENYGLKPERLDPSEKYVKFINSIKESSIKNYEDYSVLPSITIAQAILESNWGDSRLSKEFNNLFGIKANSTWKGDSVSVETSEYYDTVIVDEFRAYKSKGDSIKDHAQFLSENPRYKDVFIKQTYIEQAKALEDAGYSTVSDENGNLTYKNLLVEIIQQYNLQLLDSIVQEK